MKAKIKKLEKEFLVELWQIGVELANNAVCMLDSNGICIGIKATGDQAKYGNTIAYGSEVVVRIGENKKFKMSYFSNSEFCIDNKASYWRTIHAASILKNWKLICKKIDKYTFIIKKLEQ